MELSMIFIGLFPHEGHHTPVSQLNMAIGMEGR
jgi:hypothetical protein